MSAPASAEADRRRILAAIIRERAAARLAEVTARHRWRLGARQRRERWRHKAAAWLGAGLLVAMALGLWGFDAGRRQPWRDYEARARELESAWVVAGRAPAPAAGVGGAYLWPEEYWSVWLALAPDYFPAAPFLLDPRRASRFDR